MGLSAGRVINFPGEMKNNFHQAIFTIKEITEFNDLALKIFHYQAVNNAVYKEYITALGIIPDTIKSPEEVPFLPVSFFKSHSVLTGAISGEIVFESSGTTGMSSSRHYVADISVYEESFINGFRYFFGDPSEFVFTAILPAYSERENSSLIYMMNRLIGISKHSESGFYNDDPIRLIEKLKSIKTKGKKGILLGVSFALLDLAEKYASDLSGITIIETGGMKGRRKEITRQELHSVLKKAFNVDSVHSEYGMTELLSQGWSKGDGLFYCPPWMKVLIRDPQDPLTLFQNPGRTGGINIIDLANINSCSFLSVNDLGKLYEDGGFEVLGRFDSSEIRGCNLMVE
jgi:phenylacetate-coenzyme A ligase PaaK-like adenylate-forming protein